MAIDQPRSEVSAMATKWKRCRDVMAGEDEVKAAKEEYLPRLGGQSEQEYLDYTKRASFFNGSARTKSALVGLILSKDPIIEFPEQFKAHLDDLTLDDTPVKAFIGTALDEVAEVGRYGFLVDMPADEAADQRPYWVAYRAEQIFHWNTVRRGGDAMLALVILNERLETVGEAPDYTVTEEQRYRVLELQNPLSPAPVYTSTTYRVVKTASGKTLVADATITPLRRGQTLDFIPFVFCSPVGIGPNIEKPPLYDMVLVNLSHYRSSADLEHGRHFTALPTPWVVGATSDGSPLRIGAGVAWELSGQGAQAGMLEFTGQGLGALENALAQKKEEMAVLGARLVDHGGTGSSAAGPETAESVRARTAAAYATLMTIADSMSLALTKALRWHAWWMGVEKPEEATPPVAAKLNTAFFTPRLSGDDIKTMLLAVQAGQMSYETFYYNLTRGDVARPNVDADEEKQQILDEEEFRAAMAPEPPAAELDAEGNPIPQVGPDGKPVPPAKPGTKPPVPAKKPAPPTKKAA